MQPVDKMALRQSLKAKRSALSYAYVKEASEQIVANILSLESYQNSQSIMAYLAFGNEPILDALIASAWRDGKSVFVPYCVDTDKKLIEPVCLSSWEEIEIGEYGIRVPKEPLILGDAALLDMVLVPGLSFDRKGGRLGLGAGYYDRFLPRAREAILLGICLEEMFYEGHLPMDSFDYYVDEMVTEKGFVKP